MVQCDLCNIYLTTKNYNVFCNRNHYSFMTNSILTWHTCCWSSHSKLICSELTALQQYCQCLFSLKEPKHMSVKLYFLFQLYCDARKRNNETQLNFFLIFHEYYSLKCEYPTPYTSTATDLAPESQSIACYPQNFAYCIAQVHNQFLEYLS